MLYGMGQPKVIEALQISDYSRWKGHSLGEYVLVRNVGGDI